METEIQAARRRQALNDAALERTRLKEAARVQLVAMAQNIAKAAKALQQPYPVGSVDFLKMPEADRRRLLDAKFRRDAKIARQARGMARAG